MRFRPPHRAASAALLFVLMALGAALAQAQSYPTRPVRLIIPFPPGGSNDVVGRIVLQKVAEFTGQQFIVDNRAGAAGSIGADLVAKAPPDGYTIMVHSTSHVGNAHLYKKLNYDTLKDFTGVALLAAQPGALTIHPSLPVKMVKEFIALAKARPGTINYSSSGNGSAPHLSMALLVSMAGINLVHVPYKGGAQAGQDVASGNAQMMFSASLEAKPLLDAKRTQPIAISSLKRSPAFPDIPTVAEATGLKDFEAVFWQGMVVPAGTPSAGQFSRFSG